MSVDGVDFKVWEMKHQRMPIDKGGYSHKFNHCALKYEIAMDVYTSKVVWILGPHKAGVHDKTIFVGGLKAKIPQGRKVISDRVYGVKAEPDDHALLALPNPCDYPVLANFKACARSWHESTCKFQGLYQIMARELQRPPKILSFAGGHLRS